MIKFSYIQKTKTTSCVIKVVSEILTGFVLSTDRVQVLYDPIHTTYNQNQLEYLYEQYAKCGQL